MTLHRPTPMVALGFTLIELMIIVVIIGVLATIAIPTYNDYVLESRRSEGKSALQEAMNRQERFYTTNNAYTNNMTNLGYNNDPAESDDGFYNISAQACGAGLGQCVELSAVPQDNQANDLCGELELNSRGQRDVENADLPADECW